MVPYSYRHDANVPSFADDRPVIIFDGNCVFCSRWARFVLRHDKPGTYRLLAAQTELGTALYKHYGLDAHDYETNILLQGGVAYFKSDGTIRMFEGFGGAWRLVSVLRVIPTPWLDALYNVVACNRLRWFGQNDLCFTPPGDFKDRMVS